MSEYKWERENTKYAKARCKGCGEIFTLSYILNPDNLYCLCRNCQSKGIANNKKKLTDSNLDDYLEEKVNLEKLYGFSKSDIIIENIGRGELELMETFTKAGQVSDWENWIDSLPKVKGVYAVIYKCGFHKNCYPEFTEVGTGGHFHWKDPNVTIKTLQDKWDENYSDIVYIGRAGFDDGQEQNKSTICSRVKLYMKFGSGKAVGHWGGRYIWQLKGSGELEVYYMACNNPETTERELIEKYKPFANLIIFYEQL